MKLLKNFDIEPDGRIVWLSKEARENWEKTILDINKLVHDLEVKSVVYGDRPASWITIDENELPDLSLRLAREGVSVVPVKYVGKWEGFAHRTIQVKPGEPKNVSVVISRSIDVALDFIDAHFKGDNIRQGKLLGFPPCCTAEFQKNWTAGYIDPVWQMALKDENTMASPGGDLLEVINSHPFSNPILRYIGVRVGFHIPCRMNCPETIRLSEKRLRSAPDDLVKLMTALLSMPMSWDCYHGVAIVRTPIFYIVYNSNPTVDRYVVNVKGSWIPRESTPGNFYPLTEVK